MSNNVMSLQFRRLSFKMKGGVASFYKFTQNNLYLLYMKYVLDEVRFKKNVLHKKTNICEIF